MSPQLKVQCPKAKVGPRDVFGSPAARRPPPPRRAFTLIELMIVVAIMGVVMTIAIPSIYRRLHPDSLQKAVNDLMEACRNARASAILNGGVAELVIRPYDKQIEVMSSAAKRSGSGVQLETHRNQGVEYSTFHRDNASAGDSDGPATGPSIFSARLSPHITIEGIRLNFLDFTEDEVVRVRFLPNGTSDEFSIFLVSDKNERCQIALEVVTALADVETDPLKFR